MNIVTLQINGSVSGDPVLLHPTLIQLNGKNYLVDCGYQETFRELVRQLENKGVGLADLHAILISHDDINHLGALQLVKEANPHLLVYSSRVEADSVSGNVKSERQEQAEASLAQLPPEYQEWGLRFIRDLRNIKRVPVDVFLHDNDTIDGQLKVIATPGHTKGHLSFYAPGQRTLIAGDAVVVANGQLDIANPQFTLDLKQAVDSVQKISELPIKRLVCYHGGVVDHNVPQQLSTLLTNYSAYV